MSEPANDDDVWRSFDQILEAVAVLFDALGEDHEAHTIRSLKYAPANDPEASA